MFSQHWLLGEHKILSTLIFVLFLCVEIRFAISYMYRPWSLPVHIPSLCLINIDKLIFFDHCLLFHVCVQRELLQFHTTICNLEIRLLVEYQREQVNKKSQSGFLNLGSNPGQGSIVNVSVFYNEVKIVFSNVQR